MSKIAAIVVGALLVLAVAAAAAGSPNATSTAAPDRLVGTWDTGPIPARKLRAAFAVAGYTRANVTAFFKRFGIRNAYEFKRVFYREGGVSFLWYKNGSLPGR